MNYTTIEFYIFIIIVCFIYYLAGLLFKGRFQWCVLLAGSVYFYFQVVKDTGSLCLLSFSIIVSYVSGLVCQKELNRLFRRAVFLAGIVLTVFPLLLIKFNGTWINVKSNIVPPIGISFYTLQLIAYICDCYRRTIAAQTNFLKHVLFTIFFPHIIQGPIPKYDKLSEQLFSFHSYNSDLFMHGVQKIIYGFFLKLMIADKAAIFVNNVFDGKIEFVGGYIIIAAILYSFQLYTDFYSCTLLSQGVALMFGIHLSENFRHPYFALSIKDFWRRWHISLSTWLRDYIYIPLGGGHEGKFRKYLNICITFLISGLWHGNTMQFLVWGGMHAVYQIMGECAKEAENKIYRKIGIGQKSAAYRIMKTVTTFSLVTLAWIIFRAKSLTAGIVMIKNMFSYYNPWALFGMELFDAGLDRFDFVVLQNSILVLFVISYLQEKGISLHVWLQKQHLIIRWCIYIIGIVSIWIFGTYGYGFNAQDFIYGGF